jgi:putative addiction module component (TIGR02574 family)
MENDAGEILKQALSLPPEARVALADSLLDSLDTEVDESAGQRWHEEIRRRISELNSGAVRAVAWSEVHARLSDRIRG